MYPLPPAKARQRRIERLPADQPVWIISDLHLGDGTPSDAFFGKDRYLMALLDRVEREDAVLVVNGDAVDFAQAWSLARVLRAHGPLLGAMSRLGRAGKLYYVIGNHDMDLTLFRDVLSLRVCDELHLGDEVRIVHGYEYDPFIGPDLHDADVNTRIHHGIERWLGTWIRVPLHEFYNPVNRVAFWLGHKLLLAALAWSKVVRWMGHEMAEGELVANGNFWIWSNLGDSMGIFRPAFHDATTGPFRVLCCGHSHVPGIVRQGERVYANSGSWTFAAAQYLYWDGADVRCYDWVSGKAYEDELYTHMVDGSLYERDILQWWRENYLGWFRFREGELRRHTLPAWKRWLRDHHHLSRMRRLPDAPPLPPRAAEADNQPAPGAPPGSAPAADEAPDPKAT